MSEGGLLDDNHVAATAAQHRPPHDRVPGAGFTLPRQGTATAPATELAAVELATDAQSTSEVAGPAVWWRMLAPALAGQPTILIGRHRPATGRTEYDQVVPLTAALPQQPAALRVYNDAGMTRVLWLDFDPGRAGGGPGAVEHDANAAALLIREHGGLVVQDATARGGRHIIVPLAAPVSRAAVEPIVRALAHRFPTLDISPTLNVPRGCMAPPGALTRHGERRRLLTPMVEAHTAITRRSAPHLLDALRDLVAPTARTHAGGSAVADERSVAVPGGARPLPRLARAIAEHAVYPASRYRSGSEARQSVLVAAAGRGWCLADVLQRVTTRAWAGLSTLYAKYGAQWKKALTADWAKALLYLASSPKRGAVSQTNTRGKTTSRGAAPDQATIRTATDITRQEHRFIRRAYGALSLASEQWARNESGWTRLAVLLAGIAHAHRTGSRLISPGSRSLSLIAGLMSHTTIAAVLRAECDNPDGWFRLVSRGRGDQPARYELVIPSRHATAMNDRPLPTGRLTAVHPIFAPGLLASGVGLAAWQVIEAVAGGAGTVASVITATGVSRAHTYRALRAGCQTGLLARRADGTWRRTRRSLDRAGRHVGLADRIARRRQRYEHQRRQWRTWLAERGRRDWHSLSNRLISGGTATTEDVPLWPPGWEEHMPAYDSDPPDVAPATASLV